MKIKDTLSNLEHTIDISNKVRIYLCGVTVYDDSHIGHARTIIVFDVLRRYLESQGAEIQLVQNFTDIDDKIIHRANAEDKTAAQVSTTYIENYFRDFDNLHVKRATDYPKATQHIDDIIMFIDKLIKQEIAYTSENGVYFSVSKFPEYGKLSKKRIDQLESGARIRVDEKKKDPLDFAVWKITDEKPTWASPWGRGRPGWHIECSAMSTKYLGDDFDIHGGGRDLIFPHHENEIAQSESCTRVRFAKTWMHVGMVTINGEKMAKSTGNVKSVRHVLDDWGPNIIRLFCLAGHYSKPIDYSEELLLENLTKWRQVETCHYELINADGAESEKNDTLAKLAREFDQALDDDFNTHLALSSFFQLVKETNRLAADEKLGKENSQAIKTELQRMLDILGLVVLEISDKQRQEIDKLVSDRTQSRQEKRFKDADKIRDELYDMNVQLVDHKGKTIWMLKEPIRADR